MRFSVSSSSLSNNLMSLSKVINSKNSLAILECILFDIRNGQLTMTASDSENTMKATMPLDDCDGDAFVAISSKKLLDAVRELPEQPLNFEIDTTNYTVLVNYQNGQYNFIAENADAYPQAQPISDDATLITVDAPILADNITRSLFATMQDEMHPAMNGIYFDLTAEGLFIVATDGRKLVRNKNMKVKSETPSSFILPKKPASLLKNVLSKDEGDVVIKFDNRSAIISFPGGTLYCRLIDGRYPNYNSVIPKGNPNQAMLDRKTLQSALRRVLPFASESSQLIRFHFEMGNLEISSEDLDYATSAKESIVCDYNGQPLNIGFKGSSFLDMLNNLTSDEVIIELGDPSRAGVILPATQPDNEEILMLIMPMLLND